VYSPNKFRHYSFTHHHHSSIYQSYCSISFRSALLSIDISNQQIGLALAYYRQQTPASEEMKSEVDESENNSGGFSNSATTLLTCLPPLPYMSNKPYHSSYAFLHRPDNNIDTTTNSMRREERTVEVANHLAHLAKQREVNGILIRWPGDLGGVVCDSEAKEEKARNNRDESDELLLSLDYDEQNSDSSISHEGSSYEHGDGSMGYLRGRILYVLDSCCNSHGHNETKVSSDPLLMEGVRPFALWDTSNSELNWVKHQHRNNDDNSWSVMNRSDKFGNSFTEMDAWGRSAIFGNKPPLQHQRKGCFRYSSKELHYGYRVSSEFGSSKAASGNYYRPHHQDDFDTFQNSESYLKQFEGSLAAMHALYEFADSHLQGRITLPSWVTTTPETNNINRETSVTMGGNETASMVRHKTYPNNRDNSANGSKNDASSRTSSIHKQEEIADQVGSEKSGTTDRAESTAPPRKRSIVALAQMPVRRRRKGRGNDG